MSTDYLKKFRERFYGFSFDGDKIFFYEKKTQDF